MKELLDDEANALADEPTNADAEVESGSANDISLEEQLAKALSERDAYLDQLQRSVAEFANYRKRVDQDRIQARAIGTRDLLAGIVPISDDFRRAMESVPEHEADASWVQGVNLIERKLESVLEREGVKRIDALGKPFDPAVHEAVAVVPGSSGTSVVEVFQTGYTHGDQLLRPAMVQVGDPPEAHDAEPIDESEIPG